MGYIKQSSPNVQKISLDGNPIAIYIDLKHYKEIVKGILAPSIKVLDNA